MAQYDYSNGYVDFPDSDLAPLEDAEEDDLEVLVVTEPESKGKKVAKLAGLGLLAYFGLKLFSGPRY